MAIYRYIYFSKCTPRLTPDKSLKLSELSVPICQELGLTGRVFANKTQALAIMEGPQEILDGYYNAVASDPFVAAIILHDQQAIEQRVFHDYSVWLDLGFQINNHHGVHPLSFENADGAIPKTASPMLRLFFEAHVKKGILRPQD